MNTREEYLKYREDWKKNYKTVSETIKEKKWLIKTFQQFFCKSLKDIKLPDQDFYLKAYNKTGLLLKENDKYQLLTKKYGVESFCLNKDKNTATQLLYELKLKKKTAHKQYWINRIKSWFNIFGVYK